MINDIEIDMNKVKASKEDKKGFNDLNKLIIDINNNKGKKINKLFNYCFKYSSPSNMMSRFGDAKLERNKEQVYFINKQLK